MKVCWYIKCMIRDLSSDFIESQVNLGMFIKDCSKGAFVDLKRLWKKRGEGGWMKMKMADLSL